MRHPAKTVHGRSNRHCVAYLLYPLVEEYEARVWGPQRKGQTEAKVIALREGELMAGEELLRVASQLAANSVRWHCMRSLDLD